MAQMAGAPDYDRPRAFNIFAFAARCALESELIHRAPRLRVVIEAGRLGWIGRGCPPVRAGLRQNVAEHFRVTISRVSCGQSPRARSPIVTWRGSEATL